LANLATLKKNRILIKTSIVIFLIFFVKPLFNCTSLLTMILKFTIPNPPNKKKMKNEKMKG